MELVGTAVPPLHLEDYLCPEAEKVRGIGEDVRDLGRNDVNVCRALTEFMVLASTIWDHRQVAL